MRMSVWSSDVCSSDLNFMVKAKDRLLGQMRDETIVVLASHSAGLLRAMCTKGIVLEQGKVIYSGDIVPSLKFYHDHLARLRERAVKGLPGDRKSVAEGERVTVDVDYGGRRIL